MTGTRCCVPGCRNNSKFSRNVSWHKFPKNLQKRSEWIYRVNKRDGGMLWEPKKFHKICGIHFNISGIKSRQDDFPKYFPDMLRNGILTLYSCDRKIAKEMFYIDTQEDPDIGLEISIPNDEMYNQIQLLQIESPINTYVEETDHTYWSKENMDLFKKSQNEKDCLATKITHLESEVKRLTEENGKLRGHIVHLSTDISGLKYKLKKQKSKELSVNDVLQKNKVLRLYTGFESGDRFKKFETFLEPSFNLARKKSRNTESNSGRKCLLSFREQLFIVLCRLRVGLLEQDLAYRFNISRTTVSNIWSFWVDFLSVHLSQNPTWPRVKLTDENIPDSGNRYTDTKIIFYIKTPSDFRIQTKPFAKYKSHNTSKALISVASNGVIKLVSNLYSGQVTHKQIIFESGILDNLEADNSVMGIEDTQNSDVTVNNTLATQIDKNDIERIKETAITTVRNFKILKHIFRNSIQDKLNQIWKICCYLSNFMGEPLLNK